MSAAQGSQGDLMASVSAALRVVGAQSPPLANEALAALLATLPPEALALALERSPDHRVLRRLPPMRRSRGPNHGPLLGGLCIDVETTGLDHRRDAIIELAMQPFQADEDGRIVDVGLPRRWLEDPGVPIPPHITRLTGIRDQDVRGRVISEASAGALVMSADVVIAHNAAFDRPFVEARLPWAAGRPWACTLSGVEWRSHGLEGGKLAYLLVEVGWFYKAHRADVDVLALLRLLDHRLESGRTVLSELVENARRPRWMVEAVGAPFAMKDALKERAYRWDGRLRRWAREVSDEELDDELGWARSVVYGGQGGPKVSRMDWTTRFAARPPDEGAGSTLH